MARTLWGEIVRQLGGPEGHAMVRESDETATNPGDALRKVFARYSPCVVLVDEWVAYARQLFGSKELPGGNFDTHFTFAQQLSEAAKAAPRTPLVVSIPGVGEPRRARPAWAVRLETEAQDIEVGGTFGHQALERLKNAIGRVESPWRAASPEESYEIVRRRLFQPVTDPALFAARDAVIKKFMELYRSNANEFPAECKEKDYERKLQAAYPLHPELFDRLSVEWSSLPRPSAPEARRLHGQVASPLSRGRRAPMILPRSIPGGVEGRQSELARYLDDPWSGRARGRRRPDSLALRIDENEPRASPPPSRARTIFGDGASAAAPPTSASTRRACAPRVRHRRALPRLRRRAASPSSARTLATGGPALPAGLQATVSRLAEDRAADWKPDVVAQEIVERLKEHFKTPGDPVETSGRLHVAPRKSNEVPG